MNAARPPAANAARLSVSLNNAADGLGVIDAPAITAAGAAIPGIPGIPATAAFPAAYHAHAAARPDDAYAVVPSIPAAAAIPSTYHAADSAIPAIPGVTQRATPGTAVEAAAIPANAPLRLAPALMAAAR